MPSVRGRKPFHEKRLQMKVYVPESLMAQIQLRFWDPVRSQVRYGSVSALITQLLQDYFKQGDNTQNVADLSVDRPEMVEAAPQENQAGSPEVLSENPSEPEWNQDSMGGD